MLLTSSKHGFTNVFAFRGALILLFVLVGAVVGRSACGQTYFSTDATIDYNISLYGVVGYASFYDWSTGQNPTSPTITVVDGANIQQGLLAYNSSQVIISGGNAVGVSAQDNTQVTVSGGTLDGGGVQSANNSKVTITGGSFAGVININGNIYPGGVAAYDNSQVTVSGGKLAGAYALGSSKVIVSGGSAWTFLALDSSTLNFNGRNLLLFDPMPDGTGGCGYLVSGVLSDGTKLNNASFYLGPNAKTNLKLAPKPAAPTLLSPSANAIVSPLPTFQLKSTDPNGSGIWYTIQVTNNATQAVTTYSAGTTPSGKVASLSLEASGAAIPAGNYTWQAVAHSNGLTSSPSASHSFTVFGGVDLDTTVAPDTFWSQLSAAGWSFVIVDAWGGHTNGPGAAAQANLTAATTSPYSFKVAAYCLLNFDNKATTDALGRTGAAYVPKNQTGTWQMQQAFTAIGDPSLISQLAFMAIDVETMSVAKGVDPAGRITEALTALDNVKYLHRTRMKAGILPC